MFSKEKNISQIRRKTDFLIQVTWTLLMYSEKWMVGKVKRLKTKGYGIKGYGMEKDDDEDLPTK